MGRIAGVTAAETRERLLLAAADVFAERGYDGTRVADIAAAATWLPADCRALPKGGAGRRPAGVGGARSGQWEQAGRD